MPTFTEYLLNRKSGNTMNAEKTESGFQAYLTGRKAQEWAESVNSFSKKMENDFNIRQNQYQTGDSIRQYADGLSGDLEKLQQGYLYAQRYANQIADEEKRKEYLQGISNAKSYLSNLPQELKKEEEFWNQFENEEIYREWAHSQELQSKSLEEIQDMLKDLEQQKKQAIEEHAGTELFDWATTKKQKEKMYWDEDAEKEIKLLQATKYSKLLESGLAKGYVPVEDPELWKTVSKSDKDYSYINNIYGYKDRAALSGVVGQSYLNYLTDDEKSLYNYLYNKEGKESGKEYLDTLMDTLKRREGGEIAERVEENPWMTWVAPLPIGINQFTDGLTGFFADEPAVSSWQYAGEQIRENIKAGPSFLGSNMGQWAFDLGVGLSNAIPSLAVSTAIGGPAGTAMAVGLNGLSAAGNKYQQALFQGYSPSQARTYGIVGGALDGTLSYLFSAIPGLGKASSKLTSKVAQTITNTAARTSATIGIKALGNGFEGYLQKALDPMVRNLTLGEKNEFRLFSEEALYEGIQGVIMGGIYSAVEAGANRVRNPFYDVYGTRGKVSVQRDADGNVSGYLHFNDAGDIDGYVSIAKDPARALKKRFTTYGSIDGYAYIDRNGVTQYGRINGDGELVTGSFVPRADSVTGEARPGSTGTYTGNQSLQNLQENGRMGLEGSENTSGYIYNDGGIRTGDQGGGEKALDGRTTSEETRTYREDSQSFQRRASETIQGDPVRRLDKHGTGQIAYIPAQQVAADSEAGRAELGLRKLGASVVVTEGNFETNRNGLTTLHTDASTAPDGTIYISDKTKIPAEQIVSHEGLHFLQRQGSPLYNDFYDTILANINFDSKIYDNVARRINEKHYGGRLDLDDPDSVIPIFTELTAYIHEWLTVDPEHAKNTFGGMFRDWDAVVEASRALREAMDRGVQTEGSGEYGGEKEIDIRQYQGSPGGLDGRGEPGDGQRPGIFGLVGENFGRTSDLAASSQGEKTKQRITLSSSDGDLSFNAIRTESLTPNQTRTTEESAKYGYDLYYYEKGTVFNDGESNMVIDRPAFMIPGVKAIFALDGEKRNFIHHELFHQFFSEGQANAVDLVSKTKEKIFLDSDAFNAYKKSVYRSYKAKVPMNLVLEEITCDLCEYALSGSQEMYSRLEGLFEPGALEALCKEARRVFAANRTGKQVGEGSSQNQPSSDRKSRYYLEETGERNVNNIHNASQEKAKPLSAEAVVNTKKGQAQQTTVQGIAKVTDGEVEVKLREGKTVPLADVEFTNPTLGSLYEAAGNYVTGTAKAFVAGYDGSLPLTQYQAAFEFIHNQAMRGATLESAVKQAGAMGGMMSEKARMLAYNSGLMESRALPNGENSGTMNAEGSGEYGGEKEIDIRQYQGSPGRSRGFQFDTGSVEGQNETGNRGSYDESGVNETDRGGQTASERVEGKAKQRITVSSSDGDLSFDAIYYDVLTSNQAKVVEESKKYGYDLYYYSKGTVFNDGTSDMVIDRPAFMIPGLNAIFALDGENVDFLHHELFHQFLFKNRHGEKAFLNSVKNAINEDSSRLLWYRQQANTSYHRKVRLDLVLEEITCDLCEYAMSGSKMMRTRLEGLFEPGTLDALCKEARKVFAANRTGKRIGEGNSQNQSSSDRNPRYYLEESAETNADNVNKIHNLQAEKSAPSSADGNSDNVNNIHTGEMLASLREAGAYEGLSAYLLRQAIPQAEGSSLAALVRDRQAQAPGLSRTQAVQDLAAEYVDSRLFTDADAIRQLAEARPETARQILDWLRSAESPDESLIQAEKLYTQALGEGEQVNSMEAVSNKVEMTGDSSPRFSEMSDEEISNVIESLRVKAPIAIPESAAAKAKSMKDGYEQITYKWNDESYKYEVRWHTRTSGAPISQGNTWVIQRRKPGMGRNKPYSEFLISPHQWIEGYKWYDAIAARRDGISTLEQESILDRGHWKE